MPYDGLAGRSILVVDDEDVFSSSVVEGLEAEFPGLRSFTAGNGREALQILQEHDIELVLTDISMPVMDGLELVAAMVSRGARASVITLTAFGTRALDPGARAQGVLAVLDKPIDFAVLTAHCRQALSSPEPRDPAGVTLAGLLFLLEVVGSSCIVSSYSEDGSGRIAIQSGRLVGCTCGGEAGQSALLRLLARRDHEVELAPEDAAARSTEPLSLRDALRVGAAASGGNTRFHSSALGGRSPTPSIEHPRPDRSRDLDRAPEDRTMANTEQAISQAMNIQGCLAAALVDYESGMCLGSRGQGFPIEVAAAGNTEVLRAKMRVKDELGLEGGISDILITLDTQYHLIVPLKKGTLFLYVAIDRKSGNLAMARHKLTAIEQELVV